MHAREIGKQRVARAERHGVRDDTIDRSGVLARTMLGVPIKFGAGGEIYGEGEPIEYVYEVIHGAARTIKILSDGRRKIGGFYFAGDIFGLEEGQEHRLSAEAIADSVVCVIKRRTLLRMVGYDRDHARQLLAVTSRELTRVQHHPLMLIETAQ